MISILLASYNGAGYIREQIDSILNQTEQRFVLYVNDDASTDETWEILQEYSDRYPDRILISRNWRNSGSSKVNFLEMMLQHRDDYLMLSDQDDVWLSDKVEKTLAKMWELEAEYGKDSPLLVYTDLKVVDGELNILDESMMHRVRADFAHPFLKLELCQNTLTGCTAMYNRALAEKLQDPRPGYFVMHDWWLMLTAVAIGMIGYLPEATILYRQHGGNSIGTRNMRSVSFMGRFFLNGRQIRRALQETYEQADSLQKRYGSQMRTQDLTLVGAYAGLKNHHKLGRIGLLVKLGTWKQGIARKIAQLIYC